MTLAPNDFTHLHVHSEFSLLDGLGRITELVDAAIDPEDDIHATAAYRRHLAHVLTRRAVAQAHDAARATRRAAA